MAAPLDAVVDDLLERHRVPGCSLAVLDDGELVHEQAFGTSRADTGAPMTTATLLPACSMSKPVAVLAAVRLADDGVLDLDADVSTYLTRWTLPANGDWLPRVTLRQLASHTAGLSAHTGFPGYARGAVVPSLVEVLSGTHPANAPGARVDLLPGVQFRYSGAGTSILQLVLEEVTGTGAAQLLDDLVLAPLGMRASTFVQEPGHDDDRAHGHSSSGHPIGGGWRVQPEQCAAGLWTTPADYLRLLGAVQRAVAGAPGTLISRATAHELLAPRAALPRGRDLLGSDHIGLGFFTAMRDGVPAWFGHTGSNTGFVCASTASTTRGRAVVVMTNSENGVPLLQAVLRSVADQHGWTDAVVTDGLPGPTRSVARAGAYVSGSGLHVELSDDDGAVVLTVDGQPPLRLEVTGATTLATERLDLTVELGEDGSISLDQGGRRTTLTPTV